MKKILIGIFVLMSVVLYSEELSPYAEIVYNESPEISQSIIDYSVNKHGTMDQDKIIAEVNIQSWNFLMAMIVAKKTPEHWEVMIAFTERAISGEEMIDWAYVKMTMELKAGLGDL